MKQHILDETTIQPVSQKYGYDDSLLISTDKLVTQGLTLNLNDVLSAPADIKLNKDSIITITDKKFTKHLFSLNVPNASSIYPYVFTTYMLFSELTTDYFNWGASIPWEPTGLYPSDERSDKNVAFLNIEDLEDDTKDTRDYIIEPGAKYEPLVNYYKAPNTRLFQVELLDDTLCRVYHNDGYVKTCLTYPSPANPREKCIFSRYVPTNTFNAYQDQVFEYSLHSSSGYMVLRKRLMHSTVYIVHSGTEVGGFFQDGFLCGDPDAPGEQTWPSKAMIRIRDNSVKNVGASISRSLDSSWYRYKTGIESQNTVAVDTTVGEPNGKGTGFNFLNSYPMQQNNFLVMSQYGNIDDNNTVGYNLLPLKNHLTPYGDQAENNPHATGNLGEFCIDYRSRKNVDFRSYHKVFSGTNQVDGDDQLHLGYTAYTDKLIFRGDQITYFHMPDTMKPFTWMNINYRRVSEYSDAYKASRVPVAVPGSRDFEFEDFVGLIRAGAIAGSNPINSDKIFKKRANYRYNTPWGDSGLPGNKGREGDSHFGTWLCAWLKSPPGDDRGERKYGPMWMDRYYDDNKFSEWQVMDKEENCYDSLVDALNAARDDPANAKGYFDIPSELRLERGVQYAYYHIGPKENTKIINAFDKFLEQDDVTTYSQVVCGVTTPGDVQDDNGYNLYPIDGMEYARTSAPDPAYGDFRVSFWLHSSDWSQKFGHQIYGNYTSNGVAVVNDNVITPLLLDVQSDPPGPVMFLNTDGKKIGEINPKHFTDDVATLDNSQLFVTREDPLGDINILTMTDSYCFINTFNVNGVNTNTFTLSSGAITGKTRIVDATQKTVQIENEVTNTWESSTYIYMLFEGLSGVSRYNIHTGEFLDLTPDLFTSIELSGTNTGNDDYDGLYMLNTELDYENDKPVYQKLNPYEYRMAYDGTKWVVTDDLANYTPNSWNIRTSPDGPLPEKIIVEPTNQTPYEAIADLNYDEGAPKPIYVSADINDNNWTRLYTTPKRAADGGKLYVLDADHVCSTHDRTYGGTNKLLFTKDNNIYEHDMTNNDELKRYVGRMVIQGEFTKTTIHNIKADLQDNIWVYHGTYITKYDAKYNKIFSITIMDWVDDFPIDAVAHFDLVSEYQDNNQYRHGALVIWQPESADTSDIPSVFMFVTPDGKIKFSDNKLPRRLQTNVNNLSIASFDQFNRANYRDTNYFTFKFKAQNKFNQSESVVINYDFPVSKLTPGWHHFCFGFDAGLQGSAYFQIDGLFDDGTSTSSQPGVVPLLQQKNWGKFGFTEILSKTTTIGATQGYNDTLLSDYLEQPGYYFCRYLKMKSFRLYNYNLFRTYIHALAREHINIPDMHWTIPAGRRNHLDHVSKFHMHKLPGYKTGDYKANIVDANFTESEKAGIAKDISSTLQEYTPVNTKPIETSWSQYVPTTQKWHFTSTAIYKQFENRSDLDVVLNLGSAGLNQQTNPGNNITVGSTASRDHNIWIKGVKVLDTATSRGYRLSRLTHDDDNGWQYITSQQFDTHGDPTAASQSLLQMLQQFETGDLLVMNSYDQPFYGRDIFGGELTKHFSSRIFDYPGEYRDAHMLVSIKGQGDTLFEQHSPRYNTYPIIMSGYLHLY